MMNEQLNKLINLKFARAEKRKKKDTDNQREIYLIGKLSEIIYNESMYYAVGTFYSSKRKLAKNKYDKEFEAKKAVLYELQILLRKSKLIFLITKLNSDIVRYCIAPFVENELENFVKDSLKKREIEFNKQYCDDEHFNIWGRAGLMYKNN